MRGAEFQDWWLPSGERRKFNVEKFEHFRLARNIPYSDLAEWVGIDPPVLADVVSRRVDLYEDADIQICRLLVIGVTGKKEI